MHAAPCLQAARQILAKCRALWTLGFLKSTLQDSQAGGDLLLLKFEDGLRSVPKTCAVRAQSHHRPLNHFVVDDSGFISVLEGGSETTKGFGKYVLTKAIKIKDVLDRKRGSTFIITFYKLAVEV